MRRRVLMVTVASTALVAIAFVVPLLWLVGQLADERALGRARQAALAITPVLATTAESDAIQRAIDVVDPSGSLSITAITADGAISGAPVPASADPDRALAGEAFTTEADGNAVIHRAVVSPGNQVSVVMVLVTADQRSQGVRTAWLVLTLLALTLVSAATLVADRMARGIVAPARSTAATARALSQGDLAARAPETSVEEISDIARALNTLAARIGAMLESEREAAADLSHRLRTPMQALKLDLDRGDTAAANESLATLELAVDALITDVREPRLNEVSSCDLTATVMKRAEFWKVACQAQGRALELSTPATASLVSLTASAAAEVVDVLLENALRHTPPGTDVRLSLARDAGYADLIVEDAGPGMDPSAVTRGQSRGGSTGLGLSIVEATAKRAGGEMHIGSSPMGGARVELRLPLEADHKES